MNKNARPANVPEHWICEPCKNCERPTWIDPEAKAATLARGLLFLPVCSSLCALRAVRNLANKDT